MKLKGRDLFSKKKKDQGLSPLSIYLKKIELKSNVVVKPCIEWKKNVPLRTIIGKIGIVLESYSTKNYKILIDGKTYNLPPCHLKVL